MADTTVSANNEVQQWEANFFREYIRDSRFKPYMGTGANNVITVNEKLQSMPGSSVTISLVQRLKNAGVTGNTVLEGNEESLDNYGHQINVTTRRNGVVVTLEEEQKTAIGIRNAGREMLKLWAMEDTRDLTIQAMGAISTADGANTAYASASEADKDTWLGNNLDRVLFGTALSNTSTTDHSASLANIDNTADQLDTGIGSLAKRMAKTADAHIRPIRTTGDEEWFVMFCNSLSFRDLKTDSVLTAANREAWARGRNNPLFTDGDLIYDGVIYREVPEIAVLSGVGAGAIDVAPNYLCGVQAVGIGYAKRWKSETQVRDYKFRHGVSIEANYGVEKLFYDNVQHGMVTVYTAGVADA